MLSDGIVTADLVVAVCHGPSPVTPFEGANQLFIAGRDQHDACGQLGEKNSSRETE